MDIDQLAQSLISNRGYLAVVAGNMASGKTRDVVELFSSLERRAIPAQMIKPSMDYRDMHKDKDLDEHCSVSRSGGYWRGQAVDAKDPKSILTYIQRDTRVVGIEEFHFFDPSHDLVDTILTLTGSGISIVTTGLDRDFRGIPFEVCGTLMAHADYVRKKFADCQDGECHDKAAYSQRIIDGKPAHFNSPIIVVGGSETYEPRCGKHFECPGKPELPKLFSDVTQRT